MSKPVPLLCGTYYHIYNRGNNREDIFFEPANYRYFLRLYATYVDPVADTFAYCLLKNHFHVLVRIKQDPKGFENPSGLTATPQNAFGNLFNAYAKAVNKRYGRTGSLFQHPFGRIPVESDSYLCQLVYYIHLNPQKHGLGDFRTYPYSSYSTICSTVATQLKRDEVVEWFGGRNQFVKLHCEQIEEQLDRKLVGND